MGKLINLDLERAKRDASLARDLAPHCNFTELELIRIEKCCLGYYLKQYYLQQQGVADSHPSAEHRGGASPRAGYPEDQRKEK